jgi:RHS repeat-associated protein
LSATNLIKSGTVLWLYAATNSTLTLTGTYTDPANRPVASGGSFQASAGLEAMPVQIQDSGLSLWRFDAPDQSWDIRGSVVPESASSLPAFLAPGEAMFMNVAAPAMLTVPESALRIRYYHQDHLNSSSVTTDAQGALVEELAYYPFGIARYELQLSQIEEAYTFGQKERDRESGLHYFEARYLAGGLSRFVSSDPKLASPDTLGSDEFKSLLTDPQKLNLYAYGLNNPLKYQDPTGLDGWCYETPAHPTPGQEIAEGVTGLFCNGAEIDAGKWTSSFVQHSYEGSPMPLKMFNTLTAPVWLPVVVGGSIVLSTLKDIGHIGRGTARGVYSAGESVVNHFRTVDSDPPPVLDLPSSPEETTTRTSSVSHEDVPPPPPKQSHATPQPTPRPKLNPAPNPPRALPQATSTSEPRERERDRTVDY